MRKKFLSLLFALMVFICFVLQCTLFQKISFGGISPNLMIIVTTSIGLMKGEKSGIAAGFFSGLLIDIFFGEVIGLYALVYMYFGYLIGKFSRIFYPDDITLPIGLIFVSDLSYGLLLYVLQFMLRGRFHFTYYFVHIILPEVVYTVVLAILLYPLMLHQYKYLNVDENRSDTDFV